MFTLQWSIQSDSLFTYPIHRLAQDIFLAYFTAIRRNNRFLNVKTN
jgi:hypothetical protein